MVKQTSAILAPKPERKATFELQRKSNFELLRIISMLLIVASHWGWWAMAFPDALHNSRYDRFYFYFRTFGQVGVVLFILISGYFLCKSQFKTVSLIKLLAQIFCTVCFLLIVFFVREYINTGTIANMGITAFTDWFIPISTGRWWFVSCYVALFLLSPFLNKMIERLKKNEFRILLAVLFLFISVFPSFFVWTDANDALQNIATFILIYLIGAYIRLYEEDFKNKLVCFGGAILSLVIFIWGRENELAEYRYFIHVIALAVFLFLSFIHINIQSKFINKCAKTTFGVYLLHENAIITFWLWNDVFKIQNYVSSKWFIPYSVLSVIITFAVCAVIEYLRQICVEPLIMKVTKTPKISNCLVSLDQKMPENCVKAEDGTRGNAAPAIVLLSADALYLACKLLEILVQKAIAYKLFLFSATVIIIITAFVVKKKRK